MSILRIGPSGMSFGSGSPASHLPSPQFVGDPIGLKPLVVALLAAIVIAALIASFQVKSPGRPPNRRDPC